MIFVRGVAASSSKPANDPSFYMPVRHRPSCFVERKVNLGIRDSQGRSSTSFQVDLWPAGDLYCFTATLPDDDEETDFVLDCIKGGFYGTHLSGELGRHRELNGFLDVLNFYPSTLFLQPLPGGEDQFCWAEEHDEIAYELAPGVFDVMWDYYELTQLPEPNVNSHYPNIGDGQCTYFQVSRYDHRLATSGLGKGSGSGGTAGSDPQAPFDGGGGEAA